MEAIFTTTQSTSQNIERFLAKRKVRQVIQLASAGFLAACMIITLMA